MNPEKLTVYFNRIGFVGETAITEEILKKIHRAQHRHIPFENIDVIDGKTILLSDDAIYDKLVVNKRGGYCHEVNGLLHTVLNTLGFEVRALLGRVHLSETPTGRGHRVTLAVINNQHWLVDAGFGLFTPRSPLPIVFNKELTTDSQSFRFVRDERYSVMLQIKDEGEWKNTYSFDMEHVCMGDLEYANHYSSTHPNSVFTSKLVIVLATEVGSNVMVNQQLKIRVGDTIKETILDDEQAYFSALKEYFGLKPNISYQKVEQYF
jgi:N-hydroxyarylamine O-acetyltransferase